MKFLTLNFLALLLSLILAEFAMNLNDIVRLNIDGRFLKYDQEIGYISTEAIENLKKNDEILFLYQGTSILSQLIRFLNLDLKGPSVDATTAGYSLSQNLLFYEKFKNRFSKTIVIQEINLVNHFFTKPIFFTSADLEVFILNQEQFKYLKNFSFLNRFRIYQKIVSELTQICINRACFDEAEYFKKEFKFLANSFKKKNIKIYYVLFPIFENENIQNKRRDIVLQSFAELNLSNQLIDLYEISKNDLSRMQMSIKDVAHPNELASRKLSKYIADSIAKIESK